MSNPNSNPIERRGVHRETVAKDHLPDTVEGLDVTIENMESDLANLLKLQEVATEASEGVDGEVDIDQIKPQELGAIDLLQASIRETKERRDKLLAKRGGN